MIVVRIDTRTIIDWVTFHDVFAEAFGFPEYYGRNMDAWIDCMSYLDDPDAEMTSIHIAKGSVAVIHFSHMVDFTARCPDLYAAIVECSAFVNFRRIELGDEAVLAISFCK